MARHRGGADPGTIGFHLSALYSPVGWFSWADIARMWEAAQATDEAKRSFKNSVLGLTWVETGEAPDWQRLYERRESWQIGTVPSGGLFLTAGADVQKDRIEVDVWAWGRGLESWLVDHIVVEGGPEHAETWDELGDLLDRTWPHAHGVATRSWPSSRSIPAMNCPPSTPGLAGPATRRSRPIKGVEGFNRAAPVIGPTHVDVTEGGKKLRRGARLWTIAVSTFKSETYRYLRLSAPTDEEIAAGAKCPAGYVHLSNGTEAEWLKQLVGEQLVTVKTKRGFQRLEWQKLRERNEALDCRVYARAAAWIAGADRWTEAMWRNLEQQVGAPEFLKHEIAKEPDASSAGIAGVLRRRPEQRSRRVFQSSYMS